MIQLLYSIKLNASDMHSHMHNSPNRASSANINQ